MLHTTVSTMHQSDSTSVSSPINMVRVNVESNPKLVSRFGVTHVPLVMVVELASDELANANDLAFQKVRIRQFVLSLR